MNSRFQDGRSFMSQSQNKRHLHTKTMLSKALKVRSFASTHFTSLLDSFIKKSKNANSNNIEKRRSS